MLTPADRTAIINWACECIWGDLDESDAREHLLTFTDRELIYAMDQHYDGGYAMFVADGFYASQGA
jgi:hypothetical protein